MGDESFAPRQARQRRLGFGGTTRPLTAEVGSFSSNAKRQTPINRAVEPLALRRHLAAPPRNAAAAQTVNSDEY